MVAGLGVPIFRVITVKEVFLIKPITKHEDSMGLPVPPFV